MMWWDGLIVGSLVAAAALYLAAVAAGTLRRLWRGVGCGVGGCAGGTDDRSRSGPLVRELIQLNPEISTSK